MTSHVPFVLTASLVGTISLNDPLHLDALLIAERALFEHGPDNDRPLEELTIHADGFYHASASLLVAGTPFMPTLTQVILRRGVTPVTDAKHFDLIGPKTRRNWVPDSRSPYTVKLAKQPVLMDVAALTFHGIGDPDRILALVKNVTNLGKMARKGYGQVKSWTIDAVTPDNVATFGLVHNNKVLRAMPAATGLRLGATDPGLRAIPHRVMPPYWAADTRIDALVPRLNEMMFWQDEVDAIAA